MSLTSFLTQQPMQYQQTLNQSSTTLPQWYTDYTQGILQNAAQFANQGYQQYQGPQVAPLSSDQQASYGTVQGAKGLGANQALQGAGIATNALGQASPLQTANPYLSAANNTLGSTLGQPNAMQTASPYLQSAQQGINSSLQQPNALQAANPYLQGAATPLSQQMQDFMNPYLNQVANASNQLSAQNFTQNVLPALQDQFTQAGQVYGGSRQGEYAQKLGAAEDLNERMATASTLASGFNTALGGAEAQQQALAGMAGTAANAANAAQGTGLYGAGLTAGLGSTAGGLQNAAQQTGLSGAGLYGNLGMGAGNLQNAGVGTQLAGASTLGNLGTSALNNTLSQAMLQNQMGQQQQAQTQANYNVPMQQFQQQSQWPLTAAAAMQSALQGIQVPTGTTNYSYSPYGQSSSGLQQLLGGALSGQGLASSLSGFLGGQQNPGVYSGGGYSLQDYGVGAKKGGHIMKKAGGGPSYLPGLRGIQGVIPYGTRIAPYPARRGGTITLKRRSYSPLAASYG
jgi:hypothetical protein